MDRNSAPLDNINKGTVHGTVSKGMLVEGKLVGGHLSDRPQRETLQWYLGRQCSNSNYLLFVLFSVNMLFRSNEIRFCLVVCQVFFSSFYGNYSVLGDLGSIPCRVIPNPHIAAVCMFSLVVLLLLSYMWGSIGVHHLWFKLIPLQNLRINLFST